MKFLKVLMLVVLFVTACGGGEEVDETVDSAETEPTTVPTTIPTVTLAPEPTATTVLPEPEAVIETTGADSEPLLVADINSDYAAYSSYAVNIMMTVTDGETDETSQFIDMQVQVNHDPLMQQIMMRTQGVDEALGEEEITIQMATVDGKTFMDVPDLGCIALPSAGLEDTPFASFLEADTFLDGLNNARRVLPDGVSRKGFEGGDMTT